MATIDSGPPGIEVSWAWNGFDLNDLTDREKHIKVTKATGMHALPEADDNRSPNSSRRGEHLLPSHVRGKTIVVEGLVRSRFLDDLRVLSTAMRGAFRGRNDEGTMVLNGDPEWFFMARVMQLDIDDEQILDGAATWPFSRPFMLGLRMSDARFYVSESASVGAGDGASATASNLGTTDTDPLFAIDPASDTVVIQNMDLDGAPAITFQNVEIGRSFTVDFLARTATYDDDGDDLSGHLALSDDNQWWDELVPGIPPGDYDLKVTGGDWTATWYHASE